MSSVASEVCGTVIPGSHTHRELLARFFLDTHIEFEPEAIAWPALDAATRERLRRLPFWQEAVSTEDMTSRTVTAAAALEPDPQVRRAIALQGLEEQRHARLLQALSAHCQIDVVVPRRPVFPASLEQDFLFAGFGLNFCSSLHVICFCIFSLWLLIY